MGIEKYYGQEIVLEKPVSAEIIIIDISSRFKQPSETFGITLEAGVTIVIKEPIKAEFNGGSAGIIKTDYSPGDGFLFEIKGVKIENEKRGRNLRVGYQLTASDWFELLRIAKAATDT